jgi:molybdopterin synthase sulfur carrier subunit
MHPVQVNLLAFAQAHDRLGFREQFVECTAEETPRMLLARLAPEVQCDTMRVAIDYEYRSWDEPLGSATEVALIPPVSGG